MYVRLIGREACSDLPLPLEPMITNELACWNGEVQTLEDVDGACSVTESTCGDLLR